MVVSAAEPVIRVVRTMSIRLVSIPIAVSAAAVVRLSLIINLASIVVPVLVTIGVAVPLPGPAARPWHI